MCVYINMYIYIYREIYYYVISIVCHIAGAPLLGPCGADAGELAVTEPSTETQIMIYIHV